MARLGNISAQCVQYAQKRRATHTQLYTRLEQSSVKGLTASRSRAICIARSWVADTAWFAGLTEILGEGCM
jgi:hypothetical protein